jgi:glyoxylase-like metal-dependent hydrolase (beta-lactamase superfamily II)
MSSSEQPHASGERHSRAAFLARLGGAAVALAATGGVCAQSSQPAASARRWKGQPGSKVKRWDIITIGNLSRNEYWGEGKETAVRPVLCTCTLIRGDGFALLVDPSVADAAGMARELDRRCGIKPKDITHTFVTHEHGDHWPGLVNFPEAQWLAAKPVADALNATNKLPKKVDPADAKLFDAIDVIPTPGHTVSHHALRFDCEGLSVVAAGDALATHDFFRDRRGFYNSVNFEQAAQSMDKLAALADVLIPGHDNYFLVL